LSYRGTACELREILRELLDHLAPDEGVMKAPGFKLEKDQKSPTMKQKARYILRSRRVPDNAAGTPENSISTIEDLVASLVRATHVRASISVHVASERDEVFRIKNYVDVVLRELLQITGR